MYDQVVSSFKFQVLKFQVSSFKCQGKAKCSSCPLAEDWALPEQRTVYIKCAGDEEGQRGDRRVSTRRHTRAQSQTLQGILIHWENLTEYIQNFNPTIYNSEAKSKF